MDCATGPADEHASATHRSRVNLRLAAEQDDRLRYKWQFKPMDQKMRLVGRLLLIATASLAIAAVAQTPATRPANAVPPPSVPDTVVPLRFEVSTVKQNRSGSPHSDSDFSDGRFTASNVSLKSLLQYQAYRIPEVRILNGPKWIRSERFDIEAKTDGAAANQLRMLPGDQRRLQTQTMFQQLLADRFKLAVHWETRVLPAYAMVLAKKGLKIQPSKDPDGHFSTSSKDGELTVRGLNMAQMADAMTQEFSTELGRVVIDHTGVRGRYDFSLK